ncbi:hypothetical protein RHSIM_Rhsim09G0159800 [Rhododendron simsii]|uniref:DUF674 family protein n=1 Tax=Rhododendron simsii TaxID=118357 RepID=A0A834GD28_RHOSS|nr:hypothetical protein RHSIM_Rhsim09G0159800 [Rhododendron simsii]
MASSPSKEVITLKLLVDAKHNRLLFAEAGKDFVDFLFTFLSLPAGTIVRLLTAKSMVGCLGNLYDSVENLSDTYMLPNQSNEVLLKPKVPVRSTKASLLLTDDDAPTPAVNKMYKCGNLVMPMSTISGIALLSKFNVTNVQSLEEKVVTFGMDEGLKLLKATLHSKMVLTSVFLGGMKTIDASSSIPRDPVTVGKIGPTTDALASRSKAISEPPPNEAVASSKPKSKEFHERVEECFNITFCRQDNIIKEQKRIRRRVDKLITLALALS